MDNTTKISSLNSEIAIMYNNTNIQVDEISNLQNKITTLQNNIDLVLNNLSNDGSITDNINEIILLTS
jgi:hypothetical protein